MTQKANIKNIVEGIFIGIVTAMIVMAFFMPYYAIHHQLNTEINDVLLAYNPSSVPISEVRLDGSDHRMILFEDIRDATGTLFSPTLLFSKIINEDTTLFFSSFDYFMNSDFHVGQEIEQYGLLGTYAGFYPTEHPYGDNFLVVISSQLEELVYEGSITPWRLEDGYKTKVMPRGFRGTKLLGFLLFTGSLYFVFGICNLLVETPPKYLKDTLKRVAIVGMTILLSLLLYGTVINEYNLITIFWSFIIALASIMIVLPPLLTFWYAKKIIKGV